MDTAKSTSALTTEALGGHTLLLVDDDPSVISVLGQTLRGFGRLVFATSGLDALRLAKQHAPDLVLLDIEMPGLGGFDVCKAIKAIPEFAHVPIIFITSHDDGEHEVAGLALGAADFICKPIRPARVIARVRMHLQMKAMSDALRRSAYTDGLTGIANRRQFDDILAREWHRAERSSAPISMLMVDIDAFKKYNDLYGHPAGDKCLQAVAAAVKQVAHRPGDLAARFGGEEFALVLPETDAAGARCVAAHLIDSVRAMRLPHAASPVTPHVTVSVGVSTFDESCASWTGRPIDSRFGGLGDHPQLADLVQSADQGLYAAKNAGRDQAWFLSIDDLGCSGLAVRVGPGDGLLPGAAKNAIKLHG